MSRDDKKNATYLGDAPKDITADEIIPYFLYVFEPTWMLDGLAEHKDNMPKYLEKQIVLEHANYKEFSVEKQWWLLCIIVLKQITESHNGLFATETAKHLIRKIPVLKEEKLRLYANVLSAVVAEEFPVCLLIRPLEQKKLGVGDRENNILDYFLEHHEDLVKVLKKHLTQKDLNREYLDAVLLKDWKIIRTYSSIWNSVFEMFIYMFQNTFKSKVSYANMTSDQVDSLIKEIILFYLVAATTKKDVIEAIQLEWFEILRGLNKKEQWEQAQLKKNEEPSTPTDSE